MAAIHANFQSPVQSVSDQVGALGQTGHNPACVIYSNHPLALYEIKEVICSEPRLRPGVASYYSKNFKLSPRAKDHVLILDTCSVENWAECLSKWHLEGGIAIALISSELQNKDFVLQMLYLGTAGVLTFTEMPEHLHRAIYAVTNGNLWYRREVLYAYVKQTSLVLRKCSSSSLNFTTREKQIIDLLLQDLPNRLIARRFAVSERTIKFHVTNILRKLNVSSRKDLKGLYSPSASLGLYFHPCRPPNFQERASDFDVS